MKVTKEINMFWFKQEKPVEKEVVELNALSNRLRILFDNLCTLHDFNIEDDRLKVLRNSCFYNNNGTMYRIIVNFKSNLGPVNVSIRKTVSNKITLEYNNENVFYFSIFCRDKISTIPAFSKKFNAEIVDLALYELEHYIEENHLDKASVEAYNAQQLNKLIELSAERIKNK